jgi:NAD(P)-dependent dehydrogenase (short-subunit alcohol dehydrogenase family)
MAYLEGKVGLVTGAGSGIGRAAALSFAQQGANVVVSDIDDQGGAGTVELIKKAGGQAVYQNCDVSKAVEVEALVAKAVESFGQLDCAFNNAGLAGEFARLADSTEENFDLNYRVNLKGVFLCMKYEIQQMLKQESGGAIVSTASIAGLVGSKQVSAYCAMKHGVNGLTKSAALEYARKNIRVNSVCPGMIDTPLLNAQLEGQPAMRQAMMDFEPIGRFGEPREIGDTVAWLCSDQASFVTGHTMTVDGGAVAA